MTTFVDKTPSTEQALNLANFVDRLLTKQTQTQTTQTPEESQSNTEEQKTTESPFLTESVQLIGKENYEEFMLKLLQQSAVLFKEEKDIETVFSICYSLLRNVKFSNEIVNKIISAITTDVNDKPLLRLKLLNNLYNVLPSNSPTRYDTFFAIIKYASESNNTHLVIPLFDRVAEWAKAWGSTVDQLRELYLFISQVLANANNRLEAHNTLIKLLQTYEGADQAGLNSVVDQATKAAVQAIKYPEIIESDHLLKINAIRQLETLNPKVWELLKLFSEDTLESFEKFYKANPGFLDSVGLVYEDCVKKMRLLSLATLASKHESEVPYSVISQTLSIEETDVEYWVILAISTNVLDAKLDQMRKVAIINRAAQRVFTKGQWETLSTSLGVWRDSVQQLLSVVQNKKSS